MWALAVVVKALEEVYGHRIPGPLGHRGSKVKQFRHAHYP